MVRTSERINPGIQHQAKPMLDTWVEEPSHLDLWCKIGTSTG